MVLMPGYGNTGPYKRYRSMGMTIDAVTGHSALRGYPDEDLSNLSLVHHADAVAGLTASFAICAALHYRARTGKGQFIDMAQVDAGSTLTGAAILDYTVNNRSTRRPGFPPGNRTAWPGHPITNSYRGRHAAPHNNYRTAGGGHWD